VKWVVLSQEQIDTLDERKPGPNLAIVQTLAERRMATVNVVSPWPDNESLQETLNHELGHVWIAPITAQIPDTEASVMLEEQLVETLGVYLAGLSATARAVARRALASVVDKYAPATSRARISARALCRARGGNMDGKQVLAAIAGQDEAAALQILNEWAAEQLAAAGHPGATEPDGDEPGAAAELPQPGEGEEPMNEDPKAKPAAPLAGPETPAEPPARAAARRAAFDAEHARARKAADATVGITVRARLRELRQDGVTLPTNLEASLGKMVDLDAFELRVADLLEGRKLAAPGGTRARAATTANASASPAPVDPSDGPAVVEDAALKAEGFDDNFVNLYRGAAAHSPKNAEALLSGARARRAVHRAAAKGIAS
jgi:hypothetical protein